MFRPHGIVLFLLYCTTYHYPIDLKPYHSVARTYWLWLAPLLPKHWLAWHQVRKHSYDMYLVLGKLLHCWTWMSVMVNSHCYLCGEVYGQQSALSYHLHTCKSDSAHRWFYFCRLGISVGVLPPSTFFKNTNKLHLASTISIKFPKYLLALFPLPLNQLMLAHGTC